MLIGELIKIAREKLFEAGVESPGLNADYLAAYALGIDKRNLIMHRTQTATPEFETCFAELVARRVKREPLQYILGTWGFWDFELQIGPGVLIPRSETEELVEALIKEIKANDISNSLNFIDVGTGPGTIGIALAREFSDSKGLLLDYSDTALKFAQLNVDSFPELSQRIIVKKNNLLGSIEEKKYNLIVSNPPYIDHKDMEELMPEVRIFEPGIALDGGESGLELIEILIGQAIRVLTPNGLFAIEHGHGQRTEILKLAEKVGFKLLIAADDISGFERYIIWRK
jgi:release factor glutamine methyltransferase